MAGSVASLRGLLDIHFTEKASIDECFIDFTRPVREELLRRYDYLAKAPPSGVDTPLPQPSTVITWDANTNAIPISQKDDITDDPGQPNALATGDPELGEPPTTWHDIALSIAAEMMQRARDQVRINLGYSTSAVCASLPRLASILTLLILLGYCKEQISCEGTTSDSQICTELIQTHLS